MVYIFDNEINLWPSELLVFHNQKQSKKHAPHYRWREGVSDQDPVSADTQNHMTLTWTRGQKKNLFGTSLVNIHMTEWA